MSDRKRFNKLDEIGFIGVQKKRTAAEIRRDKIETARSIRAHKAKRAGGNKKGAQPVTK